jgi:Mg2+ and Co2+ transporter CorA
MLDNFNRKTKTLYTSCFFSSPRIALLKERKKNKVSQIHQDINPSSSSSSHFSQLYSSSVKEYRNFINTKSSRATKNIAN